LPPQTVYCVARSILRVLVMRVLRRRFGPQREREREEVAEGWI
jgi:hypothetical protein